MKEKEWGRGGGDEAGGEENDDFAHSSWPNEIERRRFGQNWQGMNGLNKLKNNNGS